MANQGIPSTALIGDVLVDLFEINAENILPGAIFRFCNYSNSNVPGQDLPVFLDGVEYPAFPIIASGFDMSIDGKLPSPQITCSNVDGSIGNLLGALDGLSNAKVTRTQIYSRHLDGREDPNPLATFPPDIYFVSKYSENALECTFSLRSSLEIGNIRLPRRRIVSLLVQ